MGLVTAGGGGETGLQLSPARMQVLCLIVTPLDPAITPRDVGF